jgi:hypothetical protein
MPRKLRSQPIAVTANPSTRAPATDTIVAMKHPGIIAIVFIVGCATGGVAAQLVVPPVRAATSPTRWEYHCVKAGGGGVTSALNQLGVEGWELASMTAEHADRDWATSDYTVDAYTFCAKRALP